MLFKLIAKNLEFEIPSKVSALFFNPSGIYKNPYHPNNDNLRCIFIHIPKTAGTSISQALFDQKSLHFPLVRYEAVDQERFDKYFKFCFVRNPFDRIHSAYYYLKKRVGMSDIRDGIWATEYLRNLNSYEEFIYKMGNNRMYRNKVLLYAHFIPQYKWIRLPYRSNAAVDFIGKFEKLAEDFSKICSIIEIENIELPTSRMNINKPHYSKAYDEQMIRTVQNIYSTDLELFDYRFSD